MKYVFDRSTDFAISLTMAGGRLARQLVVVWPFQVLLLLGLYFPTSINESISRLLFIAFFATSAVVLVVLALRAGCDRQILFMFSVPIVLWLVFCTLISIFTIDEINANPLALYAVFAFLFSIRLIKLRLPSLERSLAIISVINIAIGLGIVIGNERVTGFLSAWYSMFYDDLLPDMFYAHKPVLTFATHSLAGFFIYVFFWLNLRTFQATGKKIFLWLAVLHVGMCFALTSHTSFIFSLLALGELAYVAWRKFRWKALVFALIVLYLIPAGLNTRYSAIESWRDIGDAATTLWLLEGSGFQGRYGSAGNLGNSISYISDHPLEPIGMSYIPSLFIADSGPIEYLLRGSVPLLILVYGALFLFLRRNLVNKADGYHLFAAILAAEQGFVVLIYIRTFLLLPAFILYLNRLREGADHEATSSQAKEAIAWRHARQFVILALAMEQLLSATRTLIAGLRNLLRPPRLLSRWRKSNGGDI